MFLLGAIFGKIVEMSGVAKSIAQTIISWVGPKRAILATVLLSAILTYSGVSLFVVAFAVYRLLPTYFVNQIFPNACSPQLLF